MGKHEARIPVVELRKFVYNSLQDVFSDESICYAVYSHVMPQIEDLIHIDVLQYTLAYTSVLC